MKQPFLFPVTQICTATTVLCMCSDFMMVSDTFSWASCFTSCACFSGDELLMVKVFHYSSCPHAEITNFNISLYVSHCSHFLIQGVLPSLCYLPVTDLRCWSGHLCFLVLLFLYLSLIITYNHTHDFYGTYSHPHSCPCLFL